MTFAFEHEFRVGKERFTADVVGQVLSRVIDDLEPTLTHNAYDALALTPLLRGKPAGVRDSSGGMLLGDRSRKFAEQLPVPGAVTTVARRSPAMRAGVLVYQLPTLKPRTAVPS